VLWGLDILGDTLNRTIAAAALAAALCTTAAAAADNSNNPFYTPEADFGMLKARPAFSWDIRDAKTSCAPDKCLVGNELLAIGDLTGDGLPEIVYDSDFRAPGDVPIKTAAPILIFTPAADGTYSLLPVKTDQKGGLQRIDMRTAIIRDFNGDGVGDLFVVGTGYDAAPYPGEQNILLLSSPDGLVDVSYSNIPVQNDFAHGVDAGDLDGDGDLDIIVLTNFGAERIEPYVLWNDGKGAFTQARLDTILDRDLALFLEPGLKSRSKYVDITIADVDKDGNLDLILCPLGETTRPESDFTGFKYTRIVYGDGSGKWTAAHAVELPSNHWGFATTTTSARVADIDGDSDNDIVLSNSTFIDRAPGAWGGQYIQVFRNDAGKFTDVTKEAMFPQGYNDQLMAFPVAVELVDLNGDKSPDMVVKNRYPWLFNGQNWDSQSVMIALNDGAGHFTRANPRQWRATEYTGRYLGAADLDADGDTDLVGLALIAETKGKDVIPYGMTGTVYENMGKPVYLALPFRTPDDPILLGREDTTATDGNSINSLFIADIQNRGVPEIGYAFNFQGEFGPSGDFRRLRIAIADPVGKKKPTKLDACGGVDKYSQWEGAYHVIINLAPEDGVLHARQFDCLAKGVPGPIADEMRYLLGNLGEIATQMQENGNAELVQDSRLRDWLARVAKGEVKISLDPPQRPVLLSNVDKVEFTEGNDINSLFITEVGKEGKPYVKYAYNFQGQFEDGNFTRLRLAISDPIGKKKPTKLDACKGVDGYDQWDGAYHLIINLALEDGVYHARQLKCLSKGVPDAIADEARFVVANLADIAKGMIDTHDIDAIKHEGFRGWVTRVANGDVKFSIEPPQAPTFVTTEDMAQKTGKDPKVNSMFITEVSREDQPTVEYAYNIQGNFSPVLNNILGMRVVVADPIGKNKPEAMTKCLGVSKFDEWGGEVHAVIDFTMVDGSFHAKQLECLAGGAPEKIGTEMRFIVANFNDIARQMVEAGTADAIKHDGLKIWINRIAAGEVKVLPE
jgi:hypothetical protein